MVAAELDISAVSAVAWYPLAPETHSHLDCFVFDVLEHPLSFDLNLSSKVDDLVAPAVVAFLSLASSLPLVSCS